MVKKQGGPQVIGAVGGIKIPPVDAWIAGYKFCAKRANPKIKVLVAYSQDFVQSDKCKAQAENLIARKAKVLFQVAGGCGLGTLKAADEAKIWGIGVDKDQYNDGKARHDERRQAGRPSRVYNFIKAVNNGIPDRHGQPVLRPRERWDGSRQDQPGRSEVDRSRTRHEGSRS